MRVISGSARGHKLIAPIGLNIRPTADRVKEAVFSMIQDNLRGADFLDLFSGTGAIGIEALSRGVKSCTFVDSSKDSIEAINKNVEHVAIQNSNYKILNRDIYNAISNLKDKNFDIVFMDPPYNREIIDSTLKSIFDNNILNEDGLIIVEQSKKQDLPSEDDFKITKTKNYGLTTIIIMRPKTKGEV